MAPSRCGRSTLTPRCCHDPLYLSIAKTTVIIATSAMLIQLIIGVPLAYVMAFKAGRFEIPMLLGLVILDELNPVVRIYAWRMLLGRNGIINGALESLGIIDQPIDALLFNKFAVIVVLSTGWITYTIIPIYAAMKAIDPTAVPGCSRPGRRLVDDHPPHSAAACRTRHLCGGVARLHPTVHRLRSTFAGWRDQRLHAGPSSQ